MGKQTIGYRYYMSMLSGLCRGPADDMIEIRVGGEPAWSGHGCAEDQVIGINKPDLFGGDEKEGGILGGFRVFHGKKDQVLPDGQGDPSYGDYVNAPRRSIGPNASQFRGVLTVWYDGMVGAMSPYLKEWKFRVRRSKRGWDGDPWYPAKATIYLGGDNFTVTSARPNDIKVTGPADDGSFTVQWTRKPMDGDAFTLNGLTITLKDDHEADRGNLIEISKTDRKTYERILKRVNGNSTAFRASGRLNGNVMTFTPLKALQSIYAMNGAHIVYQCLTDRAWGRGFARSRIGEGSFIAAANTLCNEGFGLALAWYRKEDIDQFIQKVLDLIGGVLYVNRETGLIDLKLIRADYKIEDVPLFTPETGLLSIDEDDSASVSAGPNEIIGKSRDPVSNLDFQLRAQNLAAYQAQGSASSADSDYTGIPTKELLARVLLRDLRASASGLKSYTLTLDRRAWRITPGSVIRITHPGRGIASLVLRVAEIDDGNMVSGAIKIKAAVDVFGLPATSYVGVIDNGWQAPSKIATPALEERLFEASYRDLYVSLGATNAQLIEAGAAYAGTVAAAPNPTSLQYDQVTARAGEEYGNETRGDFTGYAYLNADITATATVLPIANASMFDSGNIGQALLVDNEYMRLDAISADGTTITVARGVGDTVPAPHESVTPIFTVDDDATYNGVLYTPGDELSAKVLTRTSNDRLSIDDAPEDTITLTGRQARPYAPADVRVSGVSIYDPPKKTAEPVITWKPRNRLTQKDQAIGYFDDADIPAEDGTTYKVEVLAEDGTVLRTVADLADLTWTYTAALQAEDGLPANVRVRVSAVRDGLDSYQASEGVVVLKGGWGYSWGLNWGSPA